MSFWKHVGLSGKIFAAGAAAYAAGCALERVAAMTHSGVLTREQDETIARLILFSRPVQELIAQGYTAREAIQALDLCLLTPEKFEEVVGIPYPF